MIITKQEPIEQIVKEIFDYIALHPESRTIRMVGLKKNIHTNNLDAPVELNKDVDLRYDQYCIICETGDPVGATFAEIRQEGLTARVNLNDYWGFDARVGTTYKALENWFKAKMA